MNSLPFRLKQRPRVLNALVITFTIQIIFPHWNFVRKISRQSFSIYYFFKLNCDILIHYANTTFCNYFVTIKTHLFEKNVLSQHYSRVRKLNRMVTIVQAKLFSGYPQKSKEINKRVITEKLKKQKEGEGGGCLDQMGRTLI